MEADGLRAMINEALREAASSSWNGVPVTPLAGNEKAPWLRRTQIK